MANELANAFDEVADHYDRFRTGYTDEVIEMILKRVAKPSADISACEIGCGTGQATRSFAERGVKIVCVDPGSNLLAKAQSNLKTYPNVSFVEAKFEDADLHEGSFDLVFAAQSFHWVEPSVAHSRVANILTPNGLFAAFWKRAYPANHAVGHALNELFLREFPDFSPQTLEDYERDVLADLEALVNSNKFYGCELIRLPNVSGSSTADEYATCLSTWSSIAALDEERRGFVLQRVKSTIEAYGGIVPPAKDETTLVLGRRRSEG